MLKEVGYDKSPRFGWTDDLDTDPCYIKEYKGNTFVHPVVVIPLPFMSPKLKKLIRSFTRENIW